MEKKIKGIIRSIGDIGEKVSRMQGEKKPALIEIDIILEDIRALYEDVKALQVKVSGLNEPSSRVDTSAETPSASSGGTARDVAVAESAGIADEPTIADKGETADEATIAGQEDTAEEISTDPERETDSEPSGKESEPAILADKYKNDKKLIYESLGDTAEKQDISSKMQSKPIRSIGTALGINERFQLIRDLFNGDKASFENTINTLDAAANFNEAFNYINSSFDWDMEEDSVHLLLELVRRKFIVNKNE
jgi:hypothetical protein